MEEYEVDASVSEIIRWIMQDAARKTPRLLVRASKEYTVERDFDRKTFAIGEDEDVEAVSVRGLLEVQSQRGRKDWTLQLGTTEIVGVRAPGEESAYEDDADMDVTVFIEQFLSNGPREIDLVVAAETPEAKARFNRWLRAHTKAQS